MKISIITPVFNSAGTVEGTIKSVLSQTYSNTECVIIDGGSKDGSLEIIEKYKDKISKIVSEKDNGLYDAMNKGVKLASGDIIGILNSDDVYYDNQVLETVAKEMQKSNADVCWGDLLYTKKDDLNKMTRVWKSSEYRRGLFKKGWHPPHPTFFVRRSVYEKYGAFRADLKLAADYELMLRFLEKEKVSSIYIPKILVKMREGGQSNWKNIFKIIKGNWESYRSWQLNGLKVSPFIFILKPLRKLKQLF